MKESVEKRMCCNKDGARREKEKQGRSWGKKLELDGGSRWNKSWMERMKRSSYTTRTEGDEGTG